MLRRLLGDAAIALRTAVWGSGRAPVRDRREPTNLVPPEDKIFVGGKNFEAVGEEFLGHFRTLGGLKPGHDVLDVGSGIGRMALPLTTYLSRTAQYWGIEIVPDGVQWCQNEITPRFPNFRFLQADIRNEKYWPQGRQDASDYRFPFADRAFDFVLLTSVFTHMFPRDIAHYLSEIARVLRPGGRCFATFFLLTRESLELVGSGASSQPFRHRREGYMTTNADVPETAIALEESFVRSLYAERGFAVLDPIHYGRWPGRTRGASYQDVVVSEKR
jgi:SAM-dependent methyltransferase